MRTAFILISLSSAACPEEGQIHHIANRPLNLLKCLVREKNSVYKYVILYSKFKTYENINVKMKAIENEMNVDPPAACSAVASN